MKTPEQWAEIYKAVPPEDEAAFLAFVKAVQDDAIPERPAHVFAR